MLSFQNRDRVPRYVINLDLPPSERWNQLIIDKKQNVDYFYHVTLNYGKLCND